METEFLTQLYRGLQGNSVIKWCQQTVGQPQGRPSPRRTMTQGPKQLCFPFLHWRNVLVSFIVNLTQPGVTRKWEAQLKNYLDQIALDHIWEKLPWLKMNAEDRAIVGGPVPGKLVLGCLRNWLSTRQTEPVSSLPPRFLRQLLAWLPSAMNCVTSTCEAK